ncbi:MAG TPA: TrkA family potassium uptake protein [Gaiellaceae bacterium]|nr:TrkA family potassium uptake protein [Gaiellaceae bacterium]
MNVVIVGSGRVGSSIAKLLQSEGWDVTVIDEKEEALSRLGANWPGGFVVGHGMDTEILHKAGIEDADAVVVATNGDNTNIVIGQVVKKRYGIDCVVVRVLDPARADFYAKRGMQTVCPTQTAISVLADAVRASQMQEVTA